MKDQILTGGCFCSAIRYRASGIPFWVGHCHCNSCRHQTGAPAVTFAGYRKDQVEFVSGERKFYHSSVGVSRAFCGDCGTPLTWEGVSNLDGRGEVVEFYISTFDDPEVLIPTNHVWYSEKIAWFEIHDSLPRYSGFDFNSDVVRTGS